MRPMPAFVWTLVMAGTATFPTVAVPLILTVLVSDRERWSVLCPLRAGRCSGHRHLPRKRIRVEFKAAFPSPGNGPMPSSDYQRHEQNSPHDHQGQAGTTHEKPPREIETAANQPGKRAEKTAGRGVLAPPSVSCGDMNGPAPERFRDPALVDFGLDSSGHGRRLERLGGLLVDRPLPQTVEPRTSPDLWRRAAARFCDASAARQPPTGAADRGGWNFCAPIPAPWHVRVPLERRTLVLEVRPAASGQVGVFLEQVEQWRWLARMAAPGMRLLSLFGHSGAATLAMAAAGAEVVHVDASRQAVALARRNAAASALADRPIRWICEDAATFVAREARRGSTYAGVVLDPPSWGHGPRGQPFAIDAHLVPLVNASVRLLDTGTTAGPILLTCHSPGWSHARLRDTLAAAFAAADRPAPPVESGRLTCRDDTGRELDLGGYARGQAGGPPRSPS